MTQPSARRISPLNWYGTPIPNDELQALTDAIAKRAADTRRQTAQRRAIVNRDAQWMRDHRPGRPGRAPRTATNTTAVV